MGDDPKIEEDPKGLDSKDDCDEQLDVATQDSEPDPDFDKSSCCMLCSGDLRAMTFFVMCIVSAEVVLMILEASALSKDGEVETAVNISSQYVSFFRTAFSFLNTGILAMLGQVKILESDPPEVQELARRSAGKIVQLGSIVAIIGGTTCWLLIHLTYDDFMTKLANKDQASIDLAKDYVTWVAPGLIANFLNSVFRSFYMQTGAMGLVMADIGLDLVVFTILVLAWVKQESTDELANALGCTNFMVAIFKTIIYLGYGLRPSFSSQYGFFGCSTEGLGPLYNKLGMDIVWQSVATFSTAISTFGLCVMVNQFDNNQVLAISASTCIVSTLSIISAIYGYFITWKGSEYIMTKQFWKFQGLVREGGYATVVMALCIGYLYTGQFGTCVDGMTNDEDKDDVEDHVDSLEGTIMVCAIFKCLQMLYQNVLVSTGSYKQNALATLVCSVLFGCSFAGIGLASDSLWLTFSGGYTLPAILLTTFLGWYTICRIKPRQDKMYIDNGEVPPPFACFTPCAECERKHCTCLLPVLAHVKEEDDMFHPKERCDVELNELGQGEEDQVQETILCQGVLTDEEDKDDAEGTSKKMPKPQTEEM